MEAQTALVPGHSVWRSQFLALRKSWVCSQAHRTLSVRRQVLWEAVELWSKAAQWAPQAPNAFYTRLRL